MAFLMEQAGGAASTGRERILDLSAPSLHQRVPLILGSRDEVERVEAAALRSRLVAERLRAAVRAPRPVPASERGTACRVKHPIISVTGSSGAGTTSVKKTFEQIFRREKVDAVYIEGDAFHRYDRAEMREQMAEEAKRGNKHFSHFSPETNLFEELERAFRDYGETGTATHAALCP